MSGGFFDHQQYRLDDIADSISEVVAQNETNPYYNYPPDVIEKFAETVKILREAAIRVQRIDYLLEGDDGLESFRKRWKEEPENY